MLSFTNMVMVWLPVRKGLSTLRHEKCFVNYLVATFGTSHVRTMSECRRGDTPCSNTLKGRYSIPLYPTLHPVILLQLLNSTCIYESVSSLSCPVPRPWPGMECTIGSIGPSKHPTGHPQHRQLESHTGLPIPCPFPWRVSSPHIRW